MSSIGKVVYKSIPRHEIVRLKKNKVILEDGKSLHIESKNNKIDSRLLTVTVRI